jgi:hypothetical protein
MQKKNKMLDLYSAEATAHVKWHRTVDIWGIQSNNVMLFPVKKEQTCCDGKKPLAGCWEIQSEIKPENSWLEKKLRQIEECEARKLKSKMNSSLERSSSVSPSGSDSGSTYYAWSSSSGYDSPSSSFYSAHTSFTGSTAPPTTRTSTPKGSPIFSSSESTFSPPEPEALRERLQCLDQPEEEPDQEQDLQPFEPQGAQSVEYTLQHSNEEFPAIEKKSGHFLTFSSVASILHLPVGPKNLDVKSQASPKTQQAQFYTSKAKKSTSFGSGRFLRASSFRSLDL